MIKDSLQTSSYFTFKMQNMCLPISYLKKLQYLPKDIMIVTKWGFDVTKTLLLIYSDSGPCSHHSIIWPTLRQASRDWKQRSYCYHKLTGCENYNPVTWKCWSPLLLWSVCSLKIKWWLWAQYAFYLIISINMTR